ncbi:MAG: glycosyl hydrolase family 4 [Candidatus Hermodarchaeota archaeon]
MKKKIVLIGAGSTSFGPSMFLDLFQSKNLEGSTIVLHDIDEEKLKIIYELINVENEIHHQKFNIGCTSDRREALIEADFVINSIEVGDHFKLWRQDYEIPRKYGSTQVLGECGGPGGSMHAFRIIPPILDIVKDIDKICPDAFFINFSNPMARVCLAIKRTFPNIKFVGLCHQIGDLNYHLPLMLEMKIENLKIMPYGLNHFGFLMGLEEIPSGIDLMPKFNKLALHYFKSHQDKFQFSRLTLEVYQRFQYFPYVSDTHLGEYLQFGEEFTKTLEMKEWIDRTEKYGEYVHKRIMRNYKRLKEGRYRKDGMFSKGSSGERAIQIIEAIVSDKNSYESAVNIPNDNIIENLPQDLIIECPAIVNKDGVTGVKWGRLPRNIAALLRIEATIQDLCVEAILKKSRDLTITTLAIDPNVGSFEIADKIFKEMMELQKDYLPEFY